MNSLISDLYSFEHQRVVITGASSGIGLRLAQGFAQAGAKVFATGRNQAPLTELQKQFPDSIHYACFDLEASNTLKELAITAKNAIGNITTLINAAGINLRQAPEDICFDSWQKTLDINLSVPFFLAQEFIGDMKQQEYGKIINISSLQSRFAFANSMAYGASKGGIDQLTRAMAQAWSPFGIRCNAVAPGFFPTQLTSSLFEDKETSANLAQKTALGRNGNLDDLLGPVLFLASAAADYVTGQTLFVDGGFSAC